MTDALRKATYLWFEAEFSSIHRSTWTSITASSEDALASTLHLQVVSCEDDDHVHAKRNDKDVPQNNRRPKFFRKSAKRGLSELRENQKARRTTSDPHKGLGHGDRCRGCALDTHIVVSVFSFTE